MSILLTVPPGVTSHTPGVRLQATRKLTPAERREIATRFIATQQAYSGADVFAVQESARLAQIGVTYAPGAIARLVLRARHRAPTAAPWERLLARLRNVNPRTRTHWYDPGDLCAAVGFATSRRLSQTLFNLQKRHGIEIRRRRPTWADRQARGWGWEYRVWEANS